MSRERAPVPRLPGRWRWVGWSMAAGAAYDLVFAVAILGFTGLASRVLRLDLPDDPVYLHLNGVLLALLAGLYVLAAREPVRYRGIVAVATVGRLAGAAFLGAAWMAGRPPAFVALAAGDLAFAVAHGTLLVAAARGGLPPNH